MCNQTVGLTAAALEQQGISTVAVQLLRLVAEKVRPPRALVVPFAHGYPLDSPNDPAKQRDVITATLNLLADPELRPPAIVEYRKQRTEDRSQKSDR